MKRFRAGQSVKISAEGVERLRQEPGTKGQILEYLSATRVLVKVGRKHINYHQDYWEAA
jgi:hypothetical protein